MQFPKRESDMKLPEPAPVFQNCAAAPDPSTDLQCEATGSGTRWNSLFEIPLINGIQQLSIVPIATPF